MRKLNKLKRGAKCLVRTSVFQVSFAAVSTERERGHHLWFFWCSKKSLERCYCSQSGVQEDKSESETAVIHDFYVE